MIDDRMKFSTKKSVFYTQIKDIFEKKYVIGRNLSHIYIENQRNLFSARLNQKITHFIGILDNLEQKLRREDANWQKMPIEAFFSEIKLAFCEVLALKHGSCLKDFLHLWDMNVNIFLSSKETWYLERSKDLEKAKILNLDAYVDFLEWFICFKAWYDNDNDIDIFEDHQRPLSLTVLVDTKDLPHMTSFEQTTDVVKRLIRFSGQNLESKIYQISEVLFDDLLNLLTIQLSMLASRDPIESIDLLLDLNDQEPVCLAQSQNNHDDCRRFLLDLQRKGARLCLDPEHDELDQWGSVFVSPQIVDLRPIQKLNASDVLVEILEKFQKYLAFPILLLLAETHEI
jgi:hypothetical protein